MKDKFLVENANKWMGEEYDDNQKYYVKWSSVFDNPKNKYDVNLFMNALKHAGADVSVENQYGWSNQPEVVVFTGISVEDAEGVLNALPVFKDLGVNILDVDWDGEVDEQKEPVNEMNLFSLAEDLISGYTYEQLINTVEANEQSYDEDTVDRVFEEELDRIVGEAKENYEVNKEKIMNGLTGEKETYDEGVFSHGQI